MLDKIISFSIRNKLLVGLMVFALVIWGSYSLKQIPIDAVPDITTNQVQVITQSPTLAAQEVEQFVTYPIEISLANLPDVVEIRSISRFGISVITVVFEESVDIYRARQLISEQLNTATSEIPESFGSPELGPITTGLGEVYQYVLHTAPGYDTVYTAMDLRSINDWIVKRQLAGTPGVIEVSGWGGHLKQYEVAVNPGKLNSMRIPLVEVFEALQRNNENAGASYIEKRYNTYFIRGEGLVKSLADIENIVVRTVDGIPILIRDIAVVGYGSSPRFGAITWNGKGEVVGGQTLMLKGENSFEVVNAVKVRIESIRKSLPEGVILESYIDRSELIGRAVGTVTENLILGGLIVIIILILLLGNVRGGLIVASTIPLSMLVALGLMNLFGVSANLMSLGALDFGIIVDGAVIIVESVVFYLSTHYIAGKVTGQAERNEIAKNSSSKMMRSAFFGQLIILIVFIPILSLSGIEGKMFRPMAQTVSFAMIGAIILSLTYVPMMSSWFLRYDHRHHEGPADRFVKWLTARFEPVLSFSLRKPWATLLAALLLLVGTVTVYNRLGGEFIPTLEEGDFALHQILPPGSSLRQSVEVSEKIQTTLLEAFPEVITVVSKIGSAEVPTDPMPIEVGDIMVKMKPKSEWVSASSKEEMFEKMEEVLSQIPGVQYEFTQPIQMRFNELIAGVREDIAIKIYGENPDILFQKAKEAEQLIKNIAGIGDLRVEQTQGLPQMVVHYQRNKVAQYGLNIAELNQTLRAAFAGEKAGVVFEGEKRFDLVIRLQSKYRQNVDDIRELFVPLKNGSQIPLKEVATIDFVDGPMQISREDAKRRITIGINSRGRDIESLVEEISSTLDTELVLPAGYHLDYGGTFENLKQAKARLAWAVPLALVLIFVLIFFALNSFKQTIMIYVSIPMAVIGGVFLLWIRDMPFSISAGVGFIVLSGVAVLNGLVLINSLNELKEEGHTDIKDLILLGTRRRIRPILLTASTDVLGFLPMALSNSAGAEVQRPLATVVIGGLLTATLLTLIVLPVLYSIFENINFKIKRSSGIAILAIVVLGQLSLSPKANAQIDSLNLSRAIALAKQNHPSIKVAQLEIEKREYLKKGSLDINKTNINYARGQLNAPEIDYQWSIGQSFKFPSRYLGQSKLKKEELALSKISYTLSSLDLEGKVRVSWWRMVSFDQQIQLQKELLVQLQRFDKAASRRFELGQTNILEKTRAEAKLEETRLKLEMLEIESQIQLMSLLTLLNLDASMPLKKSELLFPSIPFDGPDSSGIQASPSFSLYSQRVAISDQMHKNAKAAFLPNVNIGYQNQQIEGIGNLSSVQFGLGIPLFFWDEKSKSKSAKVEREIRTKEYEAHVLEQTQAYKSRLKSIESLKKQLQWFETQGLPTANTLKTFAEKAYASGEIGYQEYLNNLSEATKIKSNHIETLLDYHISITVLYQLQGSFE